MPRQFPKDLDELGLELKELSHEEAGGLFDAVVLQGDIPFQQEAELVKHVRGCSQCFEKMIQTSLRALIGE